MQGLRQGWRSDVYQTEPYKTLIFLVCYATSVTYVTSALIWHELMCTWVSLDS